MKKDEKRYLTINKFALEKGVFLASSVNRFLEHILSSEKTKPRRFEGFTTLGCPTLLLWRSLKQPQVCSQNQPQILDDMNLMNLMKLTISSSMNLACILSIHAMTKQFRV